MTPLSELHSISQILQLFHHRNKNQHRVAKWWKEFSELRRCIAKLILSLERNSTGVEIVEGRGKKGKRGKGKEERGKGDLEGEKNEVMQRVGFLDDSLVARCFLAFSTIVADSQYAALGLMLIGTLARLKTVLELLRAEEDEQMRGERERVAVENEEAGMVGDGDGDVDVDFGERVVRGDVLEGVEGGKSEKKGKRVLAPEEGEKVAVETPTRKPRKKKRKKGDELDDLFAGLV